MFATYLRLDLSVHSNWRAVIRAAALKIDDKSRRDPAKRALRKQFYRKLLSFHRQAQDVVRVWRL